MNPKMDRQKYFEIITGILKFNRYKYNGSTVILMVNNYFKVLFISKFVMLK